MLLQSIGMLNLLGHILALLTQQSYLRHRHHLRQQEHHHLIKIRKPIISKLSDTSKLVDWALNNGAYFPKLRIGYNEQGRRGLFATEEIGICETVLRVPLDICFVSEILSSGKIEAYYWPVPMTLQILQEIQKGQTSKYSEYLKLLPNRLELVLPTVIPLEYEGITGVESLSVFEETVKSVRGITIIRPILISNNFRLV